MTSLGSGSQSPFSWQVVLFGPISSPERHKNLISSPARGGFLLSVALITSIESDIASDSFVRKSQLAMDRNSIIILNKAYVNFITDRVIEVCL